VSTLLFLLVGWGMIALWRRSRRLLASVDEGTQLYRSLGARLDRLEARMAALEPAGTPQAAATAAAVSDPRALPAAGRRAADAVAFAASTGAALVSADDARQCLDDLTDTHAAAVPEVIPGLTPIPSADDVAAPKELGPSPLRQRWHRLEQHLIENWTGILGAGVLVAGITFLGGYTGLRLPPFYRVLMITAAAAVLFGAGTVLARRTAWASLAQWLRSSGAAVFLFACFASSAVPGLTWVADLGTALGILIFGIAANLAVAYAVRHPGFASLHVVLSLVPLGLVPQSELLLAVATVVTLAALAIGLRDRWDLHTLITLIAYTVYHVVWYDGAFAGGPAQDARIIGTGSAVLVASIAALSHYRRKYAGRPALLSLAVHLSGWTLAASAIAIYTGNTAWRGTSLLALAVVVFVLARIARRSNIRWVFLSDTLVAEIIAGVAIMAFAPFVFNVLLVPVALLALAGVCVRIGIDSGEPLLERVGVHATQGAAFVLVLTSLGGVRGQATPARQDAALLLAGALIALLVRLHLVAYGRVRIDEGSGTAGSAAQGISIIVVAVGLLTIATLATLQGDQWMATTALGAVTLYLLLARRAIGRGLGLAAWLTLGAAFLISAGRTISEHPVPPLEQLRAWVPLMIAGALAVVHSGTGGIDRLLRNTATYLLGLGVAVATYTLLEPVSSIAPAIVWLTLTLLALELANRVSRERVAPLLYLGYVYHVLFISAYLLVVLQTHTYIGPVPVRMLIEAYALAVIAFWLLFRPRAALGEHAGWRVAHPYLLELGIVFLAAAAIVELPDAWRPVAWAVLAVLAGTRAAGGRLDPRLRFYAVVLFWASAADLVVTTSGLATPALRWHEHPAFTGALAIAVQILFLAVTARRLELPGVAFPRGMHLLERSSRRIGRRPVVWLYYPFFAAVALFLFWRFDAAWWTSLWAAEAFAVFVLSLLLREPRFRHLALAGLSVCIVRLLLYDMSQADLGLRGLVFVAVGLLLLAMNTLYSRYKGRLA
jgi:hypothetical protein